jgi:hypothetical protein
MIGKIGMTLGALDIAEEREAGMPRTRFGHTSCLAVTAAPRYLLRAGHCLRRAGHSPLCVDVLGESGVADLSSYDFALGSGTAR